MRRAQLPQLQKSTDERVCRSPVDAQCKLR